MVRPNTRRGARLLLLAALAAAAVGACTRASQPALTDLSSLEQLKSRFNDDAGQVRVVLLLSPT